MKTLTAILMLATCGVAGAQNSIVSNQGKMDHITITNSCAGADCKTKEPIDVPAVDVEIPFNERAACGATSCSGGSCFAVCLPPPTIRKGCTDTSRVLLTSEDGKKHCIKF